MKWEDVNDEQYGCAIQQMTTIHRLSFSPASSSPLPCVLSRYLPGELLRRHPSRLPFAKLIWRLFHAEQLQVFLYGRSRETKYLGATGAHALSFYCQDRRLRVRRERSARIPGRSVRTRVDPWPFFFCDLGILCVEKCSTWNNLFLSSGHPRTCILDRNDSIPPH